MQQTNLEISDFLHRGLREFWLIVANFNFVYLQKVQKIAIMYENREKTKTLKESTWAILLRTH